MYKRDPNFVHCIIIVILLPISIWLHTLSFADRHPNIHGAGGIGALIIMLLPPLARLPFAITVAGLVAFALRFRWIRHHDDRIDFVLSAKGIADIGLFSSRALLWEEIDRVEVFHPKRNRDAVRPYLHFRAKTGFGVKVIQQFFGSALFTSRSTLTFNLVAAGLSVQQALDLLQAYAPGLEVTYRPFKN